MASSTLYQDDFPPVEETTNDKFSLTSSTDDDDDDEDSTNSNNQTTSNPIITAIKLITTIALFYSSGVTFVETYQQHQKNAAVQEWMDLGGYNNVGANNNNMPSPTSTNQKSYANPTNNNVHGRRLAEASQAKQISKKNPPSYMKELMDDLTARTKLMTETPPAEVKYWFEYTGPLQVSSL